MKLKSILSIVALFAVVTLKPAYCEEKIKDTMVLATWEDLATMDPQSSNRASNWMVQRNIYDRLVEEKPDGTVEPRLATSWEFVDDTTLRFKLRENVKFHNGEPFTAEDVLFTLQRGKNNPITASTFKYFDVEHSKVIDPLTFELKLTQPYAAVFNTLASGRGAIVSKKTLESLPENQVARTAIGTGPYKLSDWVTGTEIQLVRNDDYWGDKAKTQNVIFKIIPEASNRVIELETGGADIIYEVSGNDVARVDEIEGAHVLKGPSNRYMFITMSMKDPLLANKDLRYALSLAINKEALVKSIYSGTAEPANGYYPSNVFAFKDLGVLPYDPEKAKELLSKEGVRPKQQLKFLIEPREIDARIAEAVQNMWKKVGIDVDIIQMTTSSYIAQGNQFEIALRAGNANEPSNILIVYDPAFGERIQPNDEKLAAMLKNAIGIYDSKKRAQAYGEIQEYLKDLRYTIPLAFTPVIYGLRDNVRGFTCDPLQQVDLKDVYLLQE